MTRRDLLALPAASLALRPLLAQQAEKPPLNRFPRMVQEHFVDQIREAQRERLARFENIRTRAAAEDRACPATFCLGWSDARYVTSQRRKRRKPRSISPNNPRGGMLSDVALLAVTRRPDANCVPHGFRSSFRDWAAEQTAYPREVVEQALAHVNADKVEAAYLRSDLFERRRELMEDWAAHCMG